MALLSNRHRDLQPFPTFSDRKTRGIESTGRQVTASHATQNRTEAIPADRFMKLKTFQKMNHFARHTQTSEASEAHEVDRSQLRGSREFRTCAFHEVVQNL